MSLDKEAVEYASKTPRSRSLHEEAAAVMPGGNSRTTTFFDPYPFSFQRGQGARIWDADGVERVDFNGNYTSLVLGHAPPDVVKTVQAVAESGLSAPRPPLPPPPHAPHFRGPLPGAPRLGHGQRQRRHKIRGQSAPPKAGGVLG